jgi:molybdopterin synthase catalytic subunit/molybdopterin converting factor small subunit
MQVRVLFFGMLKDFAGRESDLLSMPDDCTLADVLSHYQALIPQLQGLAASIAMSINQEYAGADAKLKPGDEIALLPPVSGGSGEDDGLAAAAASSAAGAQGRAAIVREKINPQPILDRMKRPQDGAAVVFEGVVRNHTRGRPTLYLDYEAYEEMALKRMEALARQALTQFEVRDVAVVHRLGRLEIGETSVLILVASGHRAAAFEACRWLIDTLKRTVPIWKKEYFADGAVWADGEPFPSDLACGSASAGSPAGGRASK